MKFKEGRQYEQPPTGSHIARCIGLVDVGTQRHVFGEDVNMSRDVRLTFELPTELMEGKYEPKDAGRPFGVSRTLKQSLHAKSTMRKLLEGWRGKKFDKESVAAFDPKKLLGQPCRLTLVENGDYVNLDGIAPIGKSDKVPKQVNKSVYFSLEKDEFDQAVFESLGKATQEKISKSPEYAALTSGDTAGEELHGEPEGENSPENSDEPF